jgi:hypothetical protein
MSFPFFPTSLLCALSRTPAPCSTLLVLRCMLAMLLVLLKLMLLLRRGAA